MEKRRQWIVVPVLIMVILSVAVVLLRPSRYRGPVRPTPPKRPAAPTAITSPVRPVALRPIVALPDRKSATRNARHCLNALCETGASEAAVSETQNFVARLDVTPQPFAKRFSVLLKSVLAYRDGLAHVNRAGSPEASLPAIPSFPTDLIDRAAAACNARAARQPGEIVLSFAGDCTFGTVNGDDSAIRFPSLYRRSRRTDYPFALMRPWFLNDDLTVVNFECTLTNAARTADKQWHFQGPAHYSSIFPASSVEAVGLANNHSHDYLQAGFDDTVASFRKGHVPAFFQDTPSILSVHGVQVVLIGDCTVVGENTTLIDGAPQRVLTQIQHYKRPGNIVVVVMHWGSEMHTVPFPWQQTLGRKFIDAGADAVVGAHPHVVQGIELYKGKYIAYSLGNFAFGGNSLAHFPETFVLRLRFRSVGGQVRVAGASIVPCWITSGHTKNEAGILKNNYQPKPVFGKTADQTTALVLARSAKLKYGIKQANYVRLR